MPKKEPELNFVDHGEGTLMYLVLESDTLPWVAADIEELIDAVGADKLADTDVLLITPDGPVVAVEIAITDEYGRDYEATLINPDGTRGELVERIEYINELGNKHIQHYDGFDRSQYYVRD